MNALECFRELIKSGNEDEQFAGIFFLSFYKTFFTKDTIEEFYIALRDNCSTWSICDSTCIRVIGPFLAKKENQNLAKDTIMRWTESDNLWTRRASIVILFKIIMIRKDYFISQSFVFNLVDKMLIFTDDYIIKGIAWLLRIISRYQFDDIQKYLEKNKKNLPRFILQNASKEFSIEVSKKILEK